MGKAVLFAALMSAELTEEICTRTLNSIWEYLSILFFKKLYFQKISEEKHYKITLCKGFESLQKDIFERYKSCHYSNIAENF